MESMDYNYFASAPQSYHYMGYGDIMPQVGNDAMGIAPSMEVLDQNTFPISNFEYDFNTPFGQGSVATPLPTGSASPPSQSFSRLPNGSVDSGISLDLENDHDHRSTRRGSSEEKDNLTPAQSRRKAQNRAAQRAFRERKERHVRDLEAKLNLLTSTTTTLQSDNERLKLLLQRAQTENEILRATASSSPTSHQPPSFVDDPSLLQDSKRQLSPARSPKSLSMEGQNLLSASATWDLLQSHPLYLNGAVDIGEVCEKLKKMAKCEGRGPMFEEEEVRRVIEEVGGSGGDELI